MEKIYLANPYGFSSQCKELLIPIIAKLESMNYEVWEPFSRNDQEDFASKGWAYRIAQKDVQDVRDCDIVFAIVNGTPPDEGVMIELGIAIALGKKIVLFRDDFRKCSDSAEYPLNLMVFAGLPQVGWENQYYINVEDITNPEKFLAKNSLLMGRQGSFNF